MHNNQLILIGGGGHCLSVIDVILSTGSYDIKGILDRPENVGKSVSKYQIIGTDDEIPELISQGYSFVITVGQIKSALIRKKIYQKIKDLGGILATITSPLSRVSPLATIGEGTVVHHQVVINAEAVVGNNCIINTRAIVEHEAVIGDHCHISTGAILNGGVQTGNEVFVGSGSVVIQNISIGDSAIVGAGSLIVKDVPPKAVIQGYPAGFKNE